MALPLRRPISTENGQISITAAKEGFPYPVGTPVSLAELSKDLQK